MATQQCPCGYLNDGTDRCSCSVGKINNYRAKLSGPMLDRIDMHIHLPRVTTRKLQEDRSNTETSEQVKARVEQVRLIQYARQGSENSRLEGLKLEQHCNLNEQTRRFLELAGERLHLSARAYHRILRLARTIADMDEAEQISKTHVGEAIAYRSFDRSV